MARLPKNRQTFLFQTSILDRLNGPLCDAVTGTNGSQKILEELEQANLFISALDDNRRWYRYQCLFSELLRRRLSEQNPEDILSFIARRPVGLRQTALWKRQSIMP